MQGLFHCQPILWTRLEAKWKAERGKKIPASRSANCRVAEMTTQPQAPAKAERSIGDYVEYCSSYPHFYHKLRSFIELIDEIVAQIQARRLLFVYA